MKLLLYHNGKIVQHATHLVPLCQMKFLAWIKLMKTPV
jgi:hypothetical protein